MRSVLAATAAAALVASVTLASAQGPGGPGGGGQHQHMRQGPTGGGGGGGPHGSGYSGGGHAPSMGTQSRGAGHLSGSARSHGPSQGSAMHVQRGPGHTPQHAARSEHLGPRGHGMQAGPQHGPRGHALAEQRHRGQTLAEQRRMHGQNLKTTGKTATHTGVNRNERDKHGFAQAGTRSRISLTSQQRSRIHNVVLHRDFSRLRVRNVNFDIRIGTVIPRSFHLFVIPEDIVFIVPRFRHFRCFFFEDELVIVDPFTFEIVAIIPV